MYNCGIFFVLLHKEMKSDQKRVFGMGVGE